MMSQNNNDHAHLLSALEWHILHGVDDLWEAEPVDRTAIPSMSATVQEIAKKQAPQLQESVVQSPIMGANEAVEAAHAISASCGTLDSLKQAIADFEGLSIRQTASNIVFSDGDTQSNIMVIGEAPEAQDDISGRAFQDVGGQLLDKILACINLDRRSNDPQSSAYLTNILNWRPPGNRTPTAGEIAISLPFLQRHIELKQPKAIICLGGNVGQSLLQKSEPISKLRGKIHDFKYGNSSAKLIVTYQPTYLLKTPAQKKAVWIDMLMFREMLENL